MTTHLIWDWNGTLLDDYELTLAANNAAFTSVGGVPMSGEDYRRLFRRPVQSYYAAVLGRELDESEFAGLDRTYHDAYEAQLADCRLVADAEEALASWSGSQSLLSMWYHDRLVPFVDRLGLTEHFVRVDGLKASVGGGGKAEHAARHLAEIGVAGSDCVMIGDTLDDAAAAAAVGAGCVLVTGGLTDPERLNATGLPIAEHLTEAVELAAQLS